MTNTNEITVRFSFLNVGSKLKSNYKPATGNVTISGTIISHGELQVQEGLIPTIVSTDAVKGGRATLCFQDNVEGAQYISMINKVLETNKAAQIKILTEGLIRYNPAPTAGGGLGSLSIFNPDVIELEEIRVPILSRSSVVTQLSNSPNETVPFNYEAFLSFVSPKVSHVKENSTPSSNNSNTRTKLEKAQAAIDEFRKPRPQILAGRKGLNNSIAALSSKEKDELLLQLLEEKSKVKA